MNLPWRMTRAGLGALAIAAIMLASGLMKTINLLILLGDLLLVLIALNALIAWRMTRGLRVEAEPAECLADLPSQQDVNVRNESANTASIAVRVTSPVHSSVAFATSIEPAEAQQIALKTPPLKRGVYRMTTSLFSGYPFGFITFERFNSAEQSLTVLPALGHFNVEGFRRWLQRAGDGEARTRTSLARHSPHAAELRGVRGFRSGDSPRLIHWRSTARHDELLVREFDSPDSRDLVVVLEAWLPPNAEENDRKHLEKTIALAATLLNGWCRSEESPRVSLVLAGHETIEGRATPHLARTMLRELAGIAGRADVTFAAKSLSVLPPRAIRLLVSSRPADSPIAKSLQACGPWQRLSPRDVLPWYSPPKLGKNLLP